MRTSSSGHVLIHRILLVLAASVSPSLAGAAGYQNPDSNPVAGACVIASEIGGAEAAPPCAASTPNAGADDERDLETRVFRFVDGHVWRGASRPSGDGGWELLDGRASRRVDATEVARVRSERSVLQELAQLSRGLQSDDDVRQLALCRWMLEQGLLRECLNALDRVALRRPDDTRLRALLADRSFAGVLPPLDGDLARELKRSLSEGASATPARRELWVARLAALSEREVTLAALRTEIAQGTDVRREFAIRALRRIRPAAALAELERCAVSDRSRRVTKEARLALRDAADPAIATRLSPRIESPSARERVGTIDALGEAGYPEAIGPLVEHLANLMASAPANSPGSPGSTGSAGGGGSGNPRRHLSVRKQVAYAQDFNVEIAQGSSIADPIVDFAEEGVVLDVATATWQLPLEVQYEGALTARALARLVRDGVRRSPADWQRWWSEESAKKAARAKAPGVPTAPAGG